MTRGDGGGRGRWSGAAPRSLALCVALALAAAAGLPGSASAAQVRADPVNGSGPHTGPVPTGSSVLQETAGGDRAANGGVIGGLAGARFEALAGTTVVNSCTTDGTGQCWMQVDARTAGYTVEQVAAPGGFSVIPTIDTSTTGLASQSVAQTYDAFQTGQARSGALIRVPANAANGARTSSGTWMSRRENPELPTSCALNFGILVDLSGSVASTPGATTQIRTALNSFVAALKGSAAKVEIHTFGDNTPAPGTGNVNRNLVSVNSDQLPGWINGITPVSGQATNWDAGLAGFFPGATAGQLNSVLVLTDGYPTQYGGVGGRPLDGPGNATRLIEVENAVASANYLKSKDVKITAVGIGSGAATGSHTTNLKVISGDTEGSDYVTLANYSQLTDQLTSLVKTACEGTVSVTKRILNGSGTDIGPGPNWTVDAHSVADTPILKLDGSGGGYAATVSGQTNSGGAVTYRIATGSPASELRFTETPQPGYELAEFPGGRNAQCVDENGTVPVTNTTDGFEVEVGPDPHHVIPSVRCTIQNREVSIETSSLTVNKEWKVYPYEGATTPLESVGSNPPDGVRGNAQLLLSGNDALPPAGGGFNFGQTYGSLVVGSRVGVAENVSNLPPLCTLDPPAYSPALTDGKIEITHDPVVVHITNTVHCHTKLTMVKQVEGGTAGPDEWTLSSNPVNGAILGGRASGQSPVVTEVIPGTVYALAETPQTDLARSYVQDFTPSLNSQWQPNHAAGATGSWLCYPLLGFQDDDPNRPIFDTSNRYDGRNGGVTVPVGSWSECVAVNRPKPTLQLQKQVSILGVVGDKDADRWTLSAAWQPPIVVEGDGTPITPYPGHQDTVSGHGGFPATHVLPGRYTLSETSLPGSVNGTWSCVDAVSGEPVAVVDDVISLAAGTATKCKIVNTKEIDWTVAKSADPSSGSAVAPGSTITYTLTEHNATDGPLDHLHAIDTIPAGVDVVMPLPAGLSLSGRTLTWTVSDLAPHDSVSVHFQAKVEQGAAGSTLTNTVVPEDGGHCATAADCTTEHTVTKPGRPMLTVAKVASRSVLKPGESFAYTLTVANHATRASAFPVRLTDPIPAVLAVTAILTSTSASPHWQGCAVTGKDAAGYGGVLTCALSAALGPNSSAPPITVKVLVSRKAPPCALTNVAVVTWRDPASPDAPAGLAKGSVTVWVRKGTLPPTGAETSGLLAVGGTLTGLGGLLALGTGLAARRRRRLTD